MFNSWNQTLITSQAAGPAFSNSLSQTSVLNGQSKFTMPAGFLAYTGSKLRLVAGGKMSTAASSPGTYAWTVMFGTIAVFAGGASGTLATSATNLTWDLSIDLLMLSTGSGTAATLTGRGRFLCAALSAATPVQLLPASSPGAGTGFDSTISFQVDLQGTWSVASASNSITCTDYELISLT